MRLLLTRTEPDATRSAAQLRALGHDVTVAPLLRVEHLPARTIDLDGVQALVATSPNTLRALQNHPDAQRLTALPIVVVGPGTASAARDMGFTTLIEGPAAARDLPRLIAARLAPHAGALLHFAGETLAFDLARALAEIGFAYRPHIVYRTAPVDRWPAGVSDLLARGALDGVILMSPAAAEAYATLLAAAGLREVSQRLVHLCLSQAVAERLAVLPAVRTAVASKPNWQEMLALIARVASELA